MAEDERRMPESLNGGPETRSIPVVMVTDQGHDQDVASRSIVGRQPALHLNPNP